jgi:hypothetical protein
MSKIAVLNINLENSINESGKLKYYFEVADNYDFQANQATDVTSYSTLLLFWIYNRIDFIKFKVSTATNLVPAWADLPDADKKEMVRYFTYPADFTQEQIDELFTAEQQKYNWNNLVEFAAQERQVRVDKAREKITFAMGQEEINDLENSTCYNEINGNLADRFIFGNRTFLIQWILNSAGTPYENAGFAQKNYYSVERKNLLVDVLVNGNY